MAKVGIVMGSDSDMPVMSKAADMLEKFGIDYEMTIISAHREPDVFFEYAKSDYCRSWYGSTSSGYVCGNLSNAGYWYPNAYDIFRRKRFFIFNCADAVRNTSSNSSN